MNPSLNTATPTPVVAANEAEMPDWFGGVFHLITFLWFPATPNTLSILSDTWHKHWGDAYRTAAASRRRSCKRWRCCRRRRVPCRRCSWGSAPWTAARTLRPPWRLRTGWSWSRRSCPRRWAPGWATARYPRSSGRGRSSRPAACWRCRRSSRAGWTPPHWRWRSRWWRWPTAPRWLGSCAYNCHGRSWRLLGKATCLVVFFLPSPSS